MVTSSAFENQAREQLAALDGALAELSRHLERVRAARAVDAAALGASVGQVSRLAGTVRDTVLGAAAAAGRPPQGWEDRAGLERVVAEVTRVLQDREAERPRTLLRRLAEQLAAGAVRHRRHRRQEELGRLRRLAHEEVSHALLIFPPPELPPLARPECWLEAALGLRDPELSSFLEAVAG